MLATVHGTPEGTDAAQDPGCQAREPQRKTKPTDQEEALQRTSARPRHPPFVPPHKGNGPWVVKCSNAHGGYWTARSAQADDFEDSDGTHILTFHQAGEAAKQL